MEGIVDLHHDIMFFPTIIRIFVPHPPVRVVIPLNKKENNFEKIVHGKVIEIVRTITPSPVPAPTAVPPPAPPHPIDEVTDPATTTKATGHQRYRSYEYSDYNTKKNESIASDSYMIPESDLGEGQLRLLEVDNPIYVPLDTHVRSLITPEDVLHC